MGLTLIGSPHDAAGGVTDIEITSGITASYKAYEFHFLNLHPEDDFSVFTFQVNDYAQPIQTTMFRAHTLDSASHDTSMGYHSTFDQHIGEAADGNGSQDGDDRFAAIAFYIGADDATDSLSGIMTLYDPASIVYNKHFKSRISVNSSQSGGDYLHLQISSGYVNLTSAVTGIKFQYDSGDIDSGVIKMFGVS